MVSKNEARFATNFTVSIEAAEGITTGISAHDRAHTVRTAVDPDAGPGDISQPGHIFPLMANPGGVLSRAGHTEASIDLVALAGLDPSAVLVEILNEDGSMARRPQLEVFAAEHGLKLGTIADLIRYRLENERTVELRIRHEVETDFGPFTLHTYRDTIEQRLHLAMMLERRTRTTRCWCGCTCRTRSVTWWVSGARILACPCAWPWQEVTAPGPGPGAGAGWP